MPIYRTKLDLIQAVQLLPENETEMFIFLGEAKTTFTVPDMIDDSLTLVLRSLNGDQICNEGDYIMYSAQGDVLVVEKEVFEATYELDEIPNLEVLQTMSDVEPDAATEPETPTRETDQEIEDRHETELAEERDRRAGFMNTPTEGETETAPEQGLPVEDQTAQEGPPEGTTADDT